ARRLLATRYFESLVVRDALAHLIVDVLHRFAGSNEPPAAMRAHRTALDLHHGDSLAGESAEEIREHAGAVVAAWKFQRKIGVAFRPFRGVDRSNVGERSQLDRAPSEDPQELPGVRAKLHRRERLRLGEPTRRQPAAEGVIESLAAGVSGFLK